ncbi:DNA repair protein RecO [bacterium]|nr:MAG: DNA repair protein RecO [bacterium]
MSTERVLSGFIIKSQDLSEADLLLTFLTEDEGKVRAMVKSAKKMTSKLSGNLQPYNLVKITLAGNGGLAKVINVVLIEKYAEVMQSSLAMHAVLAMQELVLRSLADGQPNSDLYRIYNHSLRQLNDHPQQSPQVVSEFYLHSLIALGFAPRLLEQRPVPDFKQIYFSYSDGSFSLDYSSGAGQSISRSAYNMLKDLLSPESVIHENRGAADVLDARESDVKELLMLLTKFASFQLERELRAPSYFLVI